MTAGFKSGLVVGKFSPLHAGHAYLIGHALARCRQVFILSYSNPGMPGMDAGRRQRWLALRFPSATCLALDGCRLLELARAQGLAQPPRLPHNDASDSEQREFVLWVCLNLFQCMVDAVFTSEAYGDGFAAHLQAGFRRVGAPSHQVAHICLDLARHEFPVSGTRLRASPEQLGRWTPPFVNADLVRRVAILGGESSGKSTLAQALAAVLGTQQVSEYGRELWERQSGRLTYPDLLHIGQEQAAREDAVAWEAQKWLVCDTTPLVTLFYCLDMFGKAPQALWALSARQYDITLLCAPDFEFVQDGTRQDAAFRQRQHAWYLQALAQRDTRYTLLGGSLKARVDQALLAVQATEGGTDASL